MVMQGSFSRRLTGLVLGAVMTAGAVDVAPAGTISIGHTVWVGYGPLYLARDLGYFKDEGVDVVLQPVDDPALAMAAQAGGKLDGAATTIDELLKYRSGESCFKTVLVFDESHGGDGIVTAGSISSLAGLKGKTVALNEGSVSQFWFSYLLKKNGIPLSDVTVANMPADAAAAAFIAGSVPAAVSWEPNLTLVKTKKTGKVLVDSSSTPGVIVDVLELSCGTLKDKPKEVKGLLKAFYKAVEYLKANREKSYEIMAKDVGGYLEKPADFADAAKGINFYDLVMTKTLLGTADKPGEIAGVIALGNEIWSDLGRMSGGKIDYAAVVDSSYLP